MSVALNHTIVHARDATAAATEVAELLGLDPPSPFGPFMELRTSNGVSLDFISTDDPLTIEHYAFLVSEDDFDQIYGRILEQDRDHWADPGASQPGQINTHDGGRGVYFRGPDGHYLEIITVPYGGW